MQIFMNGSATKDYAPDLIVASVSFEFRGKTYDEALANGVKNVKEYINAISSVTDFAPEDFKTNAYSIREIFHINRLEPKTPEDLGKNLEKRVSDGFVFSQYARLEFDYDKSRLAKLLVSTSKAEGAPRMHIDFRLKDTDEKRRELIADAYEDAKKKAEALATAANKNLRDCVRVEIDPAPNRGYGDDMMFDKAAKFGAAGPSFEEEIETIDETFTPDDITVSKSISCVWETSN